MAAMGRQLKYLYVRILIGWGYATPKYMSHISEPLEVQLRQITALRYSRSHIYFRSWIFRRFRKKSLGRQSVIADGDPQTL